MYRIALLFEITTIAIIIVVIIEFFLSSLNIYFCKIKPSVVVGGYSS